MTSTRLLYELAQAVRFLVLLFESNNVRFDPRKGESGTSGKVRVLDFPPITEIDGANFGSHNPKLDLDLPLSFDIWSGVALDGKWTSWNKRLKKTRIGDFHKWNNLAGCSRACGATRVHVPAAEIFKEIISYFGICRNLPIFYPSRL
ncbi:hypothetical protein F2Q69_00059986 [Brassica cretica]|uniref:Uncharacterized protein n=1 Tax=Brassica cretica TaxID=69181 RepID=A0A8S9RH34_BRACR|nr:hypothetical protein F2Q69_00059986 [Brassica cretica]